MILKGNTDDIWVSCVDSNGNLWLEEYPRDLPALTLNGKNFAIFGVYDYYRVTKNTIALKVLRAAITTIKTNIYKYRNENDLSWYCQKHRIKDSGYHLVHIEQLETLYKITDDTLFLKMSKKFKGDTPKSID